MKNWLLIPFVIFLFVCCQSKNRIPPGVLSQKKMQAVLWDVMRADQFLADYVLSRDSSKNKITESFKFYDKIFAIHQVSKEQFEKSFSFYKEHPALFKVIMDSISHSSIQAPTQTIVPAQNAAPTQVIQPVPAPDTTRIIQKLQLDTVRKLKKKKGLSLQ